VNLLCLAGAERSNRCNTFVYEICNSAANIVDVVKFSRLALPDSTFVEFDHIFVTMKFETR